MSENMDQEKVIKIDTEIQNADINNVVEELNDIDNNEEGITDKEETDKEETDTENNVENGEDNEDNIEESEMDSENDDDDEIEEENDDEKISKEDVNNGDLDNKIKLSEILGEDDENDVVEEQEEDEIDDIEDDDDEIEDTYDDSDFYKKLEKETSFDVLSYYHPFNKKITDNELYTLINVVRNKDNIIIDPLHRTLPILTKYEKARILGVRAKQLNNGAMPFVKLNEDVIDSFLIAEKELKEKKLPFIIQRPLPNGNSEYWKLEDLEYTY